MYGIAREMSIARRRLDLAMSEQLPDHRQTLAERQGTRREAVAEVMKPDILEPGALPHEVPVANGCAAGACQVLRPTITQGLAGDARQVG